MSSLLEKFAIDLGGCTGVGEYINGGKATPQELNADSDFADFLNKMFPGGSCDDIKVLIRTEAYDLVETYCQSERRMAMCFGAQLALELLGGGAEK